MNYYNEFDPKKAAWLRELIRVNAISKGEVDERSIADVRPDDLRGYAQCHFFAGIGIWSYALRQAGWPDDEPVWTGSCPCQPFSVAGKQEGTEDRRHLWPAWFKLIRERKPVVVFGEQVSSPDALNWLDHVCDDMEGAAYTIGAADLCAPGVGAPHIRNRIFFVADSESGRRRKFRNAPLSRNGGYADGGIEFGGMADTEIKPERAYDREPGSRTGKQKPTGRSGISGVLGDTSGFRRGARRMSKSASGNDQTERSEDRHDLNSSSATGRVADADGRNSGTEREQRSGEQRQQPENSCAAIGLGDADCRKREQSQGERARSEFEEGGRSYDKPSGSSESVPGPVNGFWQDAEWVYCRPERDGEEGRYRPVEPGTFPLAHGAPERVGRLRGYGDGIVSPVAQAFIEVYIEERGLIPSHATVL